MAYIERRVRYFWRREVILAEQHVKPHYSSASKKIVNIALLSIEFKILKSMLTKGVFKVKKLTVFFEIIFVLSFVGLTLRFFGVEKAEDWSLIFYIAGGSSFLISYLLRKSTKKKDTISPD